jgi:hypothetical protein
MKFNFKEFGRRTVDRLNIHRHRRTTSHSNPRPPTPDTVHLQGMSTNHCPGIRIDPLVKNLNVHPSHLVSHRHNVAVSLSYDWLPSGHSSRSAGPNPQNDASIGLDGTNSKELSLPQRTSESPCVSQAQRSGKLIIRSAVIRTLTALCRSKYTKRSLEWNGWNRSGR